jgi:hypothetical protein
VRPTSEEAKRFTTLWSDSIQSVSMDEGRKRVLASVAGILVARHLKTTDDLFAPVSGGILVGVHPLSVSFGVTIRRMQWIVLLSEVTGR